MNMPGFAAEASLPKRNELCFVSNVSRLIRADTVVFPAQFGHWGPPIGHVGGGGPPTMLIDCPNGLVLSRVKTGGERVCTKMMEETCINRGTPWEKCYPSRCIEWSISPIEYRWECQLPQFQAVV